MKYYLYLLQIFGGGNPKIHDIIHKYGSAEKAALKISGGDTAFIPPNRLANVRKASLGMSERIAEYCKNNGIRIIAIDDEDYPTGLKNIFNPPVILFVEGDISCLKHKLSVSVVGPRNPDSYAVKLAENICFGLARSNAVIVSGLARGIDSIAHGMALRCKKPTVAVLACGMTVEYPANTFEKRMQIKKYGGAVISELLPDASCSAEYFRYRNRIISGISNGTCVAGGSNISGSMLTAAHAFEQDRELFFTMPPDTINPHYSNIIKYLRDGAHPVYDFYDIINEFYSEYEDVIDSTFLDKTMLSYLPKRIKENNAVKTAPEKQESAESENIIDEIVTRNETVSVREQIPPSMADVPMIKKKLEKPVKSENSEKPEKYENYSPRFKVTINSDKALELDYSRVTPADYLKRKRKKNSPVNKNNHSVQTKVTEPSVSQIQSKSEASDIHTGKTVFETTEKATDNQSQLCAAILGIIGGRDGTTPDFLLNELDADFGEITSALADLEIDGAVICTAGNLYYLS